MTVISPDLIERFAGIVGEKGIVRPGPDQEHYLHERRDLWHGATPLVLRPKDTGEVSRIMALAHESGTAIVPQSGNTGLVGGQIPNANGGELLLSLDRMTKIIAVDAANYSMTVEAGVTLQAVQEAAANADRLFPLALASQGSACIGGNLSSNAGGLNVLAYGNARDLCLGLEVVLPDGRVLNMLRSLRKDNTGYDLRNIFIGAEGTLGVITAAVLKLLPKTRRFDTAFIAVPSPASAVALLSLFKQRGSFALIAFEIIPEIAVQFATKHMGVTRILNGVSPWYVLAEMADAAPDTLTLALEEALAAGLVTDAALAMSEKQRADFWALRERLSESQKFEGGSIKHDVSLPISRIAEFITVAMAAVERFMPGCRFMCFGHLGDGNLHFNVQQPIGMDKHVYLSRWDEINALVHEIVLAHGGSISAEHGIGQLKRNEMARIKSPVELQVMRGLKQLFDPKGIMNPGKVLPD